MEPETRQALITALATVLATLTAIWLELDNPWWAAMSAFIVSHGDRDRLLSKGAMRVISTIVGVLLGYELALAVEGVLVLQATVLFVSAFFLTRQRFGSAYSYAWMMGMLMIAMMIYVSIMEPYDLRGFGYARVIEVCLGVGLATLVNAIIPGAVPSPRVENARDPKVLLEHNRVAFMAAVVTVAIPLLWSWLELPSMVQVAVTILRMIDPDLTRSRRRASLRLAGCFVGGLLGLLIASLQLDDLLLWALVLFVSLLFFGRLHHGEGPYAYAGTQACYALIFTFVTGSGPPDSIMPVLDRFTGILCGVALVVTASFVFAGKPGPTSREGYAK
ncbi:MAG: hypothetical protein Kilf2KO_39340 [Rhodospirillales bacterium]